VPLRSNAANAAAGLAAGQLRAYTPIVWSDTLDTYPEAAIDLATTCACFNIRKAARAVTGLYDAQLRPSGLRATQAILLLAIAAAGTPTISRLAEVMGMDRTTLARDLKPLADQGFVRVTPGGDRRTRQVRITEAGRAKARDITPLWQQAQATFITEGLGRDRWDALYAQLQDVVRIARA
jgi:DNA-binding MarR family transcriptional regulator